MKTFTLILITALSAPAAASAQSPESKPAPGDEVMRPTQRALRLTPAMAQNVSRLWMQEELFKDMKLSGEQERRIAEAAARRAMLMAHRDGRKLQAGVEYLIEMAISSKEGSKIDIKDYPEFVEKAQPLADGMREFLEGIPEDARGVLDDGQMKNLETRLGKFTRAAGRFSERLAKYRAGQVEGQEDPFSGLEDEDVSKRSDEPKEDERIQNARQTAKWEIERDSTWELSNFLSGVELVFKFDEEQKAKGAALLTACREEMNAIRTPQWKALARRNRILNNLQRQVGEELGRGPWQYRLEKEWQELRKPMEDLSGQFRKNVLGLATPQQLASVMENTRGGFEKFGLAVSDADLAMLETLLRNERNQ